MASFVRRFLSTDSGMMGLVSLLTMAGMLLKVPTFARTKERVNKKFALKVGARAEIAPMITHTPKNITYPVPLFLPRGQVRVVEF